ALAAWADRYAHLAGVSGLRAAPTAWCSWYHYYGAVSEADVLENLDAAGERDLPIDVIQIDDGWQSEIGDWLTYSGRFSSLSGVPDRIRQGGRRAGIWIAPFLAGAKSEVAREHPGWFAGDAGHNWDQNLLGLDIARGEDHLREVFGTLRAQGFDYFK